MEDDLDLNYIENFEQMLPNTDILSFHCPLTSENREMLNAETIAKMKHGAMVINTARGKLINEEALYEALKERKLRMAAMDVHYEEPMQKDSPLMDLDNVILTPHIGGLSFEAFKRMMLNAVSNIVNFDRGGV